MLIEKVLSETEIRWIAADAQDALRINVKLEGRPIALTPSSGISLASERHKTPQDWLREAHTAMVAAKHRGGAIIMGCRLGQGFLFAKPMPQPDVLEYLEHGQYRAALASASR